jgi:nucleolar protein 56
MKYLFHNVIGTFLINEEKKSGKLLKGNDLKKYKDLPELPKEKLSLALAALNDSKYFTQFYTKNKEITEQGIKESVNEDHLIIQAVSNMEELDRTINLLTKRVREWYSLYYPELAHNVENHDHFIELVLSKSKVQLAKEYGDVMGADLTKNDVAQILALADQVKGLMQLRNHHLNYLEKIMKQYCPNLVELAGVTIAAKLVQLGRSLKRLALLPASTIQLLGAEKALFRHLKTGARSPKHGIIVNHQIVQNAKRTEKGKAARMLADKLSLCARLDFFKGEFKAKEYREELERKVG